MDRYGRIYQTEDPKTEADAKRQREDVERLAEFAEKDFDTQLAEWREVIAKRQAERERKAAG